MCQSGANFWKNTYAVDRPLKCFLVYSNPLPGKLVLKILKPVSTTNWQACCCERGARCLFSPLGWSEWPAFGTIIARCLASCQVTTATTYAESCYGLFYTIHRFACYHIIHCIFVKFISWLVIMLILKYEAGDNCSR